MEPGTIRFDSVGTYVVTLIVSDSLGEAQSSPDTRTVTVANAPPDSVIDSPPGDVNIAQGATIEFSGTGTDPDGHLPLTYRWDFGDLAAESTEENPGQLTFDQLGTFVVSLTASDSFGVTDPTPATRTITVTNDPPEGVIDSPGADMTVAQGTSIDFAGTGTDPDGHLPLSYRWDFGGGLPGSSEEDPGPVRFERAGSYIVSLTVTDSLNNADPTPDTRTITVSAPNVRQSSGGGGGSMGPWVLGFLVFGATVRGRPSRLAARLSFSKTGVCFRNPRAAS